MFAGAKNNLQEKRASCRQLFIVYEHPKQKRTLIRTDNKRVARAYVSQSTPMKTRRGEAK